MNEQNDHESDDHSDLITEKLDESAIWAKWRAHGGHPHRRASPGEADESARKTVER